MADQNLIQDLPAVLDDSLRGSLLQGETVAVSLPGAMGEAFAATNRRVIILREKAILSGIDVFAYQYPATSSVSVDRQATGGVLKIVTANWVPEEQRTMFFPSERYSEFEAAAAAVTRMLAGSVTPVQPARVSDGKSCGSCGTAIGDNDAFCTSCGAQAKDVCKVCSSAMPTGSGFCPRCGTEAKIASTNCATCGARVNETIMSFCPQCGSSLTAKCVSCGGGIVEGWPRCRYCGRAIGDSEGITPHAVRAAAAETMRRSEPSVAPTASAEENPAVQHNSRGSEFYDKEQFEQAIEEFLQAVALDPGNSSYHCNLALSYDEIDREDEARAEYEKTLELDPNDPTAMLYYGYMLNEDGEPERAAEMWTRLIQTAPGSPEADDARQNLRAQGEL